MIRQSLLLCVQPFKAWTMVHRALCSQNRRSKGARVLLINTLNPQSLRNRTPGAVLSLADRGEEQKYSLQWLRTPVGKKPWASAAIAGAASWAYRPGDRCKACSATMCCAEDMTSHCQEQFHETRWFCTTAHTLQIILSELDALAPHVTRQSAGTANDDWAASVLYTSYAGIQSYADAECL